VALRLMKDNRFANRSSSFAKEEPVKLRWEKYKDEDDVTFLTEIVVIAEDRKLLLADCSEIVSELSEICKSGSVSTEEHATLTFVVKVSSLAHLQNLMDSLSQVRSVMSVERRVSIALTRKTLIELTARH
jgi:(p)ppGpp synthase/HD superfamily hydrolase